MATALHDEHPASEDVHRRRWWVLALLCTSLMIVIIGAEPALTSAGTG